MARPIRWILWSLSGLLALPLLGLILIILTSNSQFGRTSIERAVSIICANQVVLSGLGGNLLGELTIKRIELLDSSGPWLTIDELILNWLPIKLFTGEVAIERLQAKRIALARQPIKASTEPDTSGKLSLPMAINLSSLMIERLEIAPSLAGQDANFGIKGQLRLTGIKQGKIELSMWQLQSKSTYNLQASLIDDILSAHLSLHEATQGLLVTFAGLRNQNSLNLEASLEGPLDSVHSHVDLKFDNLQALLDGKINFTQTSADLTLTATSPAMQIKQDLAWRALAVNLQLQGPLNGLNVSGGFHIDGLNAAQTSIGSIGVKLQGTGGQIDLNGEVTNLRQGTDQIDFLQAVPLAFRVQLSLDKPDYPIAFELKHPLIAVIGQSTYQESQLKSEMALTLPDLKPVATLGGLQMTGNGKLTLKYAHQGVNSRLEAAGMLNTSGNNSSWAKLLNGSTKFDLLMDVQGKDIAISSLHLEGKTLSLSANGGLISDKANFNWQAQLNDLSSVVTTYSGQLAARGQLIGGLDDLTLSADLNGKLATKDFPSNPITASIQLHNLVQAPNGRINLAGILFRDPIDIKLAVNKPDNKTIQLVIDKADWKSAHAQGGLIFTQGSPFPVGKIEMKIMRLADLQPLLNRPLSGSVNAIAEAAIKSGRPQATLSFDARNSGVEGIATVDSTKLELIVSDPTGLPRFNGLLSMDGISAEKLNGSVQIKLDGPLDALNLNLSAFLPKLSASEARLSGAALLNSQSSSLMINAMQASWHEQTLKLLAPAKIDFKEGLMVDRLRLGLQQAELELSGRFSPELALTAELHQISAEQLSLFAPNLAMTGTLHADAQLNGSLQLPNGLIRLNADKLQMQHGPGRALPPAQFIATVLLHGDVADLDAKLNAGKNINVQIAGQAPITNTGLFNLQSEASLDLKQLDPILTAQGRQLHGQLVVKTKLVGPWSFSSLTGNAEISHGDWQDYTTGAEIRDITALLTAADGTLRLSKFQAHAGPGTLSATGNLDLLSEGLPIELTLAARNARPLASDRLTVNLDADVVLRGQAAQQMNASGRISINRAEIRIPERMPASIAVLKLSNADGLPPPPKANKDITLNLEINAPQKIFIRGRGVYAELGGKVNIAGTTNNPQPDGEFKLRSGQFTLAGQSLVFNQGTIGFDSNSLIDPTLNFVANTSRNNIAATLTVTGTAQNPKIVLSSTPVLPQDEILANLLYGKGTSSLSPLEMVQIASTVASLTGLTTGINDPLEGARKRLSLDRLSFGGANPSLEAGRYIAPGIYLGAKQGITSGTPQATIQIEVSKQLKLEGAVGSGASSTQSSSSFSNSVGLIYQFEY